MSQKIRASGVFGVAERQQLERVRIRHGEDVGLLDPGEALDRGAVERHPVGEGVLQLGRGDGEALEVAEDVGEPQAHESHAALLDAAHDVVALLVLDLTHGVSLAAGVPLSLFNGAAHRLGEQAGDDVGVGVGVRATVLEVAASDHGTPAAGCARTPRDRTRRR